MVLTELPGTPGDAVQPSARGCGPGSLDPTGFELASPNGRFYLLPDGILA